MTSYARAAWVFRRLLGFVYLCAFVSLLTQLPGLVGSRGILPARDFMQSAQEWASAEGIGTARFHLVPTLFWISTSDLFLRVVCVTGAVASALLLAGVAPLAAMATAWVAYLSLSVVAQDFLSYQWDALLLETGFLALFIAPFRWRDRARDAPSPTRPAVWLMLWLLVRLNVASGAVKLTSGDETWRELTALAFHFETQPLPTPVAWYMHHLPVWILKPMTAGVIAIELLVALLIFGRRSLRLTACGLLVGLQAMIALTGNYAWFNVLSASLCLFLLDDRLLVYSPPGATRRRRAGIVAVLIAAAITLPATLLAFTWSLGLAPPGAGRLASLQEALAPFRIANRYGLFAVMTTSRPEIIVEGSDDGVEWRRYEFKYKPGDLQRQPPWVAPHQPRLDWQMWFAALSTAEQEPWFRRFLDRLLEGSPEVLALLEHDPFDGHPPRFVRAGLMEYKFSGEGRAWWTAQPRGDYLPAYQAVK